MKLFQQSPSLKIAFQKQVDTKKSAKHQEIHDFLGDSVFGALGSVFYEIKQAKNELKGSAGEWGVSMLLNYFPDSWVMFKNALIPTFSRTLTEIDVLIIGAGGVFLIEVKTWKGSLSAYKDKWKRREGNFWTPIDSSPTSQSAYHQKMFTQWITSAVPNLPKNFINAPVVFPIAKWIGTTDCSVPVLHGVRELLQMIGSSPECLTSTQVQEIAQAVQSLTVSENTTPKLKPIKRQNFTN